MSLIFLIKHKSFQYNYARQVKMTIMIKKFGLWKDVFEF